MFSKNIYTWNWIENVKIKCAKTRKDRVLKRMYTEKFSLNLS